VAQVEELALTFGDIAIPYVIGRTTDEEFLRHLAALRSDRIVIVTDDTVGPLYGRELVSRCSAVAPTVLLAIRPGEGSKTWDVLGALCTQILSAGATRRSCVVALGGGVVGNVAGLAAAIVYRGISLVHVPTTVVAALDSVISLKQAVNSIYGKNQLGTHFAPSFIYVDTKYFESLPTKERRSAFGEIVKNALIADDHAVPDIVNDLCLSKSGCCDALLRLLRFSVELKLTLMRDDPKEHHRGLLLEYGHTIGHAVEFCDLQDRGRSAVSHGEAVALGMVTAARISRHILGTDFSTESQHYDLLTAAGIAPQLPEGLSISSVLDASMRDNKRGLISCDPDEVPMVVLKSRGRPLWTKDYPLVPVPVSTIRFALAAL
jgi:3-dehydroquinate synthetase